MDQKEGKILGLNRNAFFLGLVSLFNDFSNAMIQAIMPYFLSQTLGIPKVGIGFIEGFANATASTLRIFSGWLSDRLGSRKSLAVMGYTLSVATRPFFMLYEQIGKVGLGMVRVTDRVGKGFRDSPRDALLVASVQSSDLGKSFGYQRAMDALGGFLGPLGAFLLLYVMTGGDIKAESIQREHYNVLFLTAFVIGMLAVFSFLFVKEIKAPKNHSSGVAFRELKSNKRFSRFIFTVFVFGLGSIPEALMFVRTVELSYSILLIPVVYFVYNGIFAFLAGPIGKLSDKVGERLVISAGFLSAIVACFILAFTYDIPSAFFAFSLMGFYSAATDGIERALASKLIDREHLGAGEGILQAAIGISSLISAVIGGYLWDAYGHQSAFIYWGVASVIGFITFAAVNMNGDSVKPLRN